MRIKKFLRFITLLIFIIMAAIIPVPFKFYKKDNLPSYEIEQVDKKKEDEDAEIDEEAFY